MIICTFSSRTFRNAWSSVTFGLKGRYRLGHGSGAVSKFNEFEPRLESAKNRFQLSAALNLEKF